MKNFAKAAIYNVPENIYWDWNRMGSVVTFWLRFVGKKNKVLLQFNFSLWTLPFFNYDTGGDPSENVNEGEEDLADGDITNEERENLIQQLMQLLASGDSEECSICLENLREPVITRYKVRDKLLINQKVIL